MNSPAIESIIEFAQKLIQTPSQNGIDKEVDVANLITEKLKSFNLPAEIVSTHFYPSVISKIIRDPSKPTILLQACLDTAPIGELNQWHFHPTQAGIHDNKLYGRGAADCKTGISIFCHLAQSLINNPQFKGNLILGFDADEQGGRFTGINQLIKSYNKVDAAILGYSDFDEIAIGARGWLRLRLATKGVSAHTGSRSKKGINAIQSMSHIIQSLYQIDLHDSPHPYFPFGPNLCVSQIHGGTSINLMPSLCEVMIDIRLLPNQSDEFIMEKVRTKLNSLKASFPDLSYEIEVTQYQPAFCSDDQHPFVQIFHKNAKEILQKNIPLTASGPGSVGNILSRLNIPIINAFGPASANVHAGDEWIDITTIEPVVQIMSKTLIEFCQK